MHTVAHPPQTNHTRITQTHTTCRHTHNTHMYTHTTNTHTCFQRLICSGEDYTSTHCPYNNIILLMIRLRAYLVQWKLSNYTGPHKMQPTIQCSIVVNKSHCWTGLHQRNMFPWYCLCNMQVKLNDVALPFCAAPVLLCLKESRYSCEQVSIPFL